MEESRAIPSPAIKPVSVPNTGWNRADIEADRENAFRQLTAEEISDLKASLAHLKSKHKHSPSIDNGKINLFELLPDDFPLGPAFSDTLKELKKQLQTGRGFQTLRGFPVSEHSIEDLELVFFGIGMHLGVARPQGKASLYLTNVRDIGTDYRGSSGRGYTSNAALDFHSDGADVAGLFVIKSATISGGESLITSSIRAHNEMLRLRPDLLAELYKPMIFGRQSEEAPEEPPYYECPIMGVSSTGDWSCRFIRNHIRVAQLSFPEIPRLTPKQIEAMDLFDALLLRDDLCYRSHFAPGDLFFFNNYTTLHSRTSYIDHPDFENKRHLLRLWLCCPDSPQLPESFKAGLKDFEKRSLRGGFRGQGVTDEIRAWEARMAKWHGLSNRIYEDREAYLRKKGGEGAKL